MTRRASVLVVSLAAMIAGFGLNNETADAAPQDRGGAVAASGAKAEDNELYALPEVVDENTLLDKAAGDTIRVQLTGPKSSQLLAAANGTSLSLIVTSQSAAASHFASLSSTSLDVPHPFTFRVLNLFLSKTAGGPLSVPASDSLRSCLQMSQLLQLQPDDFQLIVRVDLAANSVATLANEWLTVHLQDVGDGGGYGSFRCELVSI